MKWFLCILAIVPCVASAATNTLADGAFATVSNAVAQATTGDWIVLPTGTNEWTTNTLTITKAMTLAGAGMSNSVMLGSANVLVKIYAANTRLTGLGFRTPVNTSSANESPIVLFYGLHGVNYSGSNVITGFRIDRCAFAGGKFAVEVSGYCEGLIDRNWFTECDGAVRISGDQDYSWARPVVPGTTNCVVSENNDMVVSATYSSQEMFYHQYGGRHTMRNNRFWGPNAGIESRFLDSHGNWGNNLGNPDPMQFRGQPLLEIYSNLVAVAYNGRCIHIRGGSSLIWDNDCWFTNTGPAYVVNWRLEDSIYWYAFSTNNYPGDYPLHDQVQSTFVWGNRKNGSDNDGVVWDSGDASVIAASQLYMQEGRDYWLHAPQSTNTYYPYVPLAYPHPLGAAQDTAAPAAASQSRIGTVNAGTIIVRGTP